MTTKVVSEAEIDKITCPGCKANIEIERDKPTHRIVEHDHAHDDTSDKLNTILEKLNSKPEPIKDEPKEPKQVVPAYIEKYKCKGCGKIHDNDAFEGPAIGQCDTCGEKFTKKKKGKCPYCKPGQIEAIEDDDVERYEEGEDDEDE